MSEAGKNYSGIDIFRIIAAVMVIAIHTYPLADYSATADFVLTRIISRVAVPFFFMTSGFFLISQYAKDTRKLSAFLKKTAVLYGIGMLLYVPINIYNGYFGTERLLEILWDVFFDGTMYHLWYLPASMLGACIAWYLVRKLGFSKALIISAVLYVFGLLGDSYYGVTERVGILSSVYAVLFQVFEYSRNGIFFAPIFFVLGGIAASRKDECSGREKLLFVLFFDLMLVEGLVLNVLRFQRHDSMYVFLVPCVYFLFRWLLGLSGKRKKYLSSAALIMYIIHPMVIVAVRLAAKISGMEKLLIDNNIVHFIAVAAISAGVSFVCVRIFPKRKTKRPLRAWREIDFEALKHNAKALQAASPEGCKLMAVVKADAYGHGAFEVSACLEIHGVKAFAVATIEEGIELRKYGIHGEILVLGYTAPERAKELKKYRLTQTVVNAEHAEALDRQGKRLNVHIKIDTGMHRLGFDASDTQSIITCFELKNLTVTGVFSHLCAADTYDEDSVRFTQGQINAFKSVLDEMKYRNIKPVKVHLQSSYGLLNYPEIECDYIRAGIALYGAYSSLGDATRQEIRLRPVLSLKARVVQVKSIQAGESVGYGRCFKADRQSRIATVSIGYADGVPRELSGRGKVLINGHAVPIIGRICMDQLSADVTDIPDVKIGDQVVLIGGEITAEHVAECAATITNEILSRMGKRLDIVME